MMIYLLCKRLAAIGKMTAEKLAVYHAGKQLTQEQYAELTAQLSPS